MLQMRPYYGDTHVLMEDHMQHLLQQIESCLASDTADITAAKRLMLVLIKFVAWLQGAGRNNVCLA